MKSRVYEIFSIQSSLYRRLAEEIADDPFVDASEIIIFNIDGSEVALAIGRAIHTAATMIAASKLVSRQRKIS